MKTEFEVRVHGLSKEEIRRKLSEVGGKLVLKEALLKRENLELPESVKVKNAQSFVRVRTGHGKTTLTYKSDDLSGTLESMKEAEVEVSDFETTIEILKALGCNPLVYAENFREVWSFGGAEICIDTWPFLDTHVEVEAESSEVVEGVVKKLGWEHLPKTYGAVGKVYMAKYNITIEQFLDNRQLTFEMQNPFQKN
jgi:adenylate cyclase class 2